MEPRELARLYHAAHNAMRNVDGLAPQEAFDELLKYLFFKEHHETQKPSARDLSSFQLRTLFAEYLSHTNSWSDTLWPRAEFTLSDPCLSDVNAILGGVLFTKLKVDVRSQALKEFLTPEIRRGLGIFLTPDVVVSAIVACMPNAPDLAVLDPACGSGTFLLEYCRRLTEKATVNGADKSPRMLLLAQLNLGNLTDVVLQTTLGDSLQSTTTNQYDLILTNPPFGVSLHSRDYDFARYQTCRAKGGQLLGRQTSEIVFIERCLELLKPGGRLAVVIPKSIATNSTLQIAREALAELGYIEAIWSLPPETFAATGTQTTTIVLFLRKYRDADEKDDAIELKLAPVTNVGYDATGRPRDGEELSGLVAAMSGQPSELMATIPFTSKSQTFVGLADVFIHAGSSAGKKLIDITEYVGTGRTPARADYAESGHFLIKVGNLSGAGINWQARDRNFINDVGIEKRKKSKKPLLLEPGDILLTSSAHNPVYIAKKCDIFTGAPSFLESDFISFVGEVMVIRVKKDFDAYLLLAFLRSQEAIDRIQSMVRGQTAHLHARDLRKLVLPPELFESESKFTRAADLLRKQAELSLYLSELKAQESQLLD